MCLHAFCGTVSVRGSRMGECVRARAGVQPRREPTASPTLKRHPTRSPRAVDADRERAGDIRVGRWRVFWPVPSAANRCSCITYLFTRTTGSTRTTMNTKPIKFNFCSIIFGLLRRFGRTRVHFPLILYIENMCFYIQI